MMAERDLRYEQRFQSQNEAIAMAKTAAEKAIAVALTAAEKASAVTADDTDKRFEAIGEVRQTVRDMSEKLETLGTMQDTSSGRSAGITASWGYVLGIVGVVGGAIAVKLVFG